jgi:hypothetical protein
MKKKIKVREIVDGQEVIKEIEIDQVEPGEDGADDEADEGDGTGADDDAGDEIDDRDPEKLKAEIKRLRAENAKARIKNKETLQSRSALEAQINSLKKSLGVGEGDDESPEDKIAAREARIAQLEMENHLRDIETEFEIPTEHRDYFRFLLGQETAQLEEGEELEEEKFLSIVQKVKALPGGSKKKGGSTGLNTDDAPGAAGGKGALTVEQFAAMSLGERTAVYNKNPAEYNRLFAAARDKKLIS